MTNTVALQPGDVLPLVRELTGSPDPLALYRLLTDDGRRPGTFLLESAETGGGVGERSLLGVGIALRITCIDHVVSVEAMSPNGHSILPWIADRLAGLDGPVVTTTAAMIHAFFPATVDGNHDEAARGKLPSPLDALRTVVLGVRLLAHPIDCCHLAAGVFSYDLIELFETLPAGGPEPARTAHFEFVVPDRLIILDHVGHRSLLVANAYGGAESEANYSDAVRAIGELLEAVEAAHAESESVSRRSAEIAPPEMHPDLSDEHYAALVLDVKRHIVAGDVFQIVASRTFCAPCKDPLAAYAQLRSANPSPYLFYVVGNDVVIFGASPETAVRVSGTPPRVTIRPIAGTAARGRNADGLIDEDLDGRREAALRLDEKELAEHMMLVDLARNDVARVSTPGTRRVTRLLTVDRYAHVMHLVSEVQGVLADGIDALHAYAAAMNMGTVVGAPKIRAAQMLREVETTRRGTYGGAVGYIDNEGSMDTALLIRAAVVRDGTARVRVGAGIVFDSDPASEALETRRKASAVLHAIAAAEDAHV